MNILIFFYDLFLKLIYNHIFIYLQKNNIKPNTKPNTKSNMKLNNEVEDIIANKCLSSNGWTKLSCNAKGGSDLITKPRRVIRIGNCVNCNGDIMKNLKTGKQMELVMEKYNIRDYNITTIDTKYEYSYELDISENTYEELVNKIKIRNTNN